MTTIYRKFGSRETWYDQIFSEGNETKDESAIGVQDEIQSDVAEVQDEVRSDATEAQDEVKNEAVGAPEVIRAWHQLGKFGQGIRNFLGMDLRMMINGEKILIPSEGRVELTTLKSKINVDIPEIMKSSMVVYQDYERPMIVNNSGRISEFPKFYDGFYLIVPREIALVCKNFNRETRDLLFPLNSYDDGEFYRVLSFGVLR